jgi:acetolactate synthase-1/2/3 large subunit
VPEALPYPDARALDRAGELLASARHPVLVVGMECRPDREARWLLALAESLPAPVLTTEQGKGAFPDSHPLALGAFPGGETEKALLARADLVVAVGLDPAERPPPHSCSAATIRLARTPAAEEALPLAQVTGEISEILEELAPRLRGRTRADWDVALLDHLKRGRV